MDRTFTITSHRRDWVFPTAKDARHLFTSDTHADHGNIIKYSCRPFLTDDEKIAFQKARAEGNPRSFKPSHDTIRRMNRTMIDRFNEVARPQDIIWHLGDLAWNGKRSAAEFLGSLNCKNIIFIWGNHDDPDVADLIPHQMAQPRYGNTLREAQAILPCYDQCYVKIDGQEMHLSHYPGDSWEASHKSVWHLYGHVHGNKNKRHENAPWWSLSTDVGVDSHNFYPWTMEQLRALFAKRETAYQEWKAKMRDKEDGGMTPVCQLG